MLSNAYFLAKFRFDTAENEPAKNLQNFRKMHFRKMHFRKMHFQKMHLRKRHFRKMYFRKMHFRKMYSRKMHFRKMHFRKMHFRKMHIRKMHFSKVFQIFGGLVLGNDGCIKTKFCKKICVRQHFLSSTSFASFCTVAISKF